MLSLLLVQLSQLLVLGKIAAERMNLACSSMHSLAILYVASLSLSGSSEKEKSHIQLGNEGIENMFYFFRERNAGKCLSITSLFSLASYL